MRFGTAHSSWHGLKAVPYVLTLLKAVPYVLLARLPAPSAVEGKGSRYVAVRIQARRTSATLQAWAMQPRGV
jgi:hypothetical protein